MVLLFLLEIYCRLIKKKRSEQLFKIRAQGTTDAMIHYKPFSLLLCRIGTTPLLYRRIEEMQAEPLSSPCLPNLSSYNNATDLGSMRLGKYTEWFNDVYSTDISDRCEDVLNMLFKTHGCKSVEVVIPELHETRTSHILAIGSESMCSLFPDYMAGNADKLTLNTRTNLAFFRSFSASDYVAAARLRRRIMYYHMEIFKKVDFIVTPTTGSVNAPFVNGFRMEILSLSYIVKAAHFQCGYLFLLPLPFATQAS